MKCILALFFITFPILFIMFSSGNLSAQSQEYNLWITYENHDDTQSHGKEKHIVLISGDEEYRSEEMLPQLAKILTYRHGFKTTVLFAINPETGYIDPNYQNNIPGLENLIDADLMIMFIRFRALPEEQIEHIVNYLNEGKPIIGIRPAIAAFLYENNDSPYVKYSFNSDIYGWKGGFSRRFFGETWRYHHGDHGKESSAGLINGLVKEHEILTGVKDIWTLGDVYGIENIKGVKDVLLYGLPLQGMDSNSPPNLKKSLMPVAWTKQYIAESGEKGRSFFTTMGTSVTLNNKGYRRLLINAVYWGLEMEVNIKAKNDIRLVGEYEPTSFGFDDFRQGLKPSDFELNRVKDD